MGGDSARPTNRLPVRRAESAAPEKDGKGVSAEGPAHAKAPMGLHANPSLPVWRAQMSEAERPCKALSAAATGFRVLGRPWAPGRTAVGGDLCLPPSSCPRLSQPGGPGKPGLRGSPFQVGPGSPPGRPPQRGPGHQSGRRGIRLRKGRAGLEEVLRRAPFHPGWEPTPGRPIWAPASPCRPGEGGRGAALCDLAHATACLWASASPAARLPVSQAGAGLGERSLGRLALPAVETTRNHSSCPHTADPGAGPM